MSHTSSGEDRLKWDSTKNDSSYSQPIQLYAWKVDHESKWSY